MCLLILGGTAEGRQVADSLHQHGVTLIYSIAGLVRIPTVTYRVVSGGFSQFGGLINFIQKNSISAVLDATHPYAEKMSITAISAANSCAIPCWRFHRLAWQQQESDDWQVFNNWQELLPQLMDKKSVFLTVGQIQQSILDALISLSGERKQLLVRSAVAPKVVKQNRINWITAIGPFNRHDEQALMEKYQVDALVCKNSGGEATVAKILVARELGISVFLLARPQLPEAAQTFNDLQICENFILDKFKKDVAVSHAV